MKTIDDYFRDWEAHVFGYGYGSGERAVLSAVKAFFSVCDGKKMKRYDYCTLEHAIGESAAWLLINTFCHNWLIEYGTSPRFGWLTKEGERLKVFFDGKTVEELVSITAYSDDCVHCDPAYCNCQDVQCKNPFWINDKNRKVIK